MTLLSSMLRGPSRVVGSGRSKALLAATVRTKAAFDVFLQAVALHNLRVEDLTPTLHMTVQFQHLVLPQPQLPVRLLQVTCDGYDPQL